MTVGKVLQFSYFKEKTKKARQYSWRSVSMKKVLHKDNIGVLCNWYNQISETSFSITEITSTEVHQYYSLTRYICTLPHGCFNNIVSPDNEPVASVVKFEVTSSLVTAKEFSIGNESASFVNELIILKVAEHTKASTAANITKQTSTWVQFKKFSLSINEKNI